MLGLASISDRIHTLEQTLQRAAHPPHQLPQLQLHDAAQPAAAGHAAAAAAAPSASPSPATVLSQLTQLSSAFQHILSLDPTVHEYVSRASSIESLLECHGGSGSAGAMCAGGGGGALVGRELEVVLSASDQFESSAHMLQQLQALLPVLEQKWPLEDFSSLNARVSHVQSLLPRQAFEAAQSHVALERYLAAYNALLDFLSRQFVLWNQQLNAIEAQIDATLAKKSMQAR